ncbi:MAG: RagB/SusD family nutrient uptake outer membrane protein [Bacteroidales bacterium]|nr:RagB/SusD family nutrient uptake outer membrane protein [Bacteroidales bacterium]
MKKYKYISVMLLLVGLLLSSCNKDFLNTKPLSEFSEVDVWKDPALVETFINDIYRKLGIPFDIDMIACYVDEAEFTPDWGVNNFNNCLLTPDQIPAWTTGWFGQNTVLKTWSNLYKSIRACNIFFEKVGNVDFENEEQKNNMVGQVHFLRAYFYHELTSLYGGVPIITHAYTLTDEYKIPRDTYEDCINFIVSECDSAAALLPEVQSGDDNGRATKGAALALKARTLLYAASDLHNKVSEVFPGYSNPELLGYTSGSQQERWQKARDAAKAVIDMGLYSLYKADPGPGDSVAQNYNELFILKESPEDIFVRFFTPKTDEGWDGYNPGLYCGSNGYHNWGNNTPVQELVDAFEMADGTPFDWNNPSETAQPYKNRDPRFYADILYEGAHWRKRPTDVQGIDPVGIIQVGTWQKWDETAGDTVEVYGLDTRKGPIEDWNGGYTGYYLRKFIDPTVDAQYFRQDVPWRYFRYAEVLLNYAEACIELGEDAQARTYLNMIRHRAGMPDITESGDALRQRYRNERRVEMCYEEQRFFDVRRWVIGPDAYHPMHAANVVYELQPDHTTATIPTITRKVYQIRAWDDKAYFFPIMRDELNRNDQLIQNPGY